MEENNEKIKNINDEKTLENNIKDNLDKLNYQYNKANDKSEILYNEHIVKNSNSSDKKNKKFFMSIIKSKPIISVCILFLGIIIVYLFIGSVSNSSTIKNIARQSIRTTTVEEVSDLKKGINNIYDATVYIKVSNEKVAISSGSGFVYKKDDNYGYILTNYHVIKDGNNFLVAFTNGVETPAELINGDEYYDIAILRVSAENVNKVATFGDSDALELGDTVFTVGSPLGKEYIGTITRGIISGVNRMVTVSLTSGSYRMEVVQTDASINNGNSGGPICNVRGEVVGITSSKLAGTGVEGMGFAIPINSVLSIITSIENGEKIERPYLGIQVIDIANAFALQYYNGISISSNVDFGAVVSVIENGKPASRAGLAVGDVIVEMDGIKVEDSAYFKYLLYQHKIGDKIKVKYYRNNNIGETTVELTETVKSE